LVLLLLGYILFAPVFVLGPLAGLLLVSRPASLREVWWLAGAAAWLGVTLPLQGALPDQFARSAGVFVAGAFVALVVAHPGRWFPRAAAAIGLAAASLALWCWHFGIGWSRLVASTAAEWREGVAIWSRLARAGAQADGAEAAARAGQLLADVETTMVAWAPLYPALLALIALGGLAVAWAWYHRVAARPLGEPLGPLSRFTFSDQFVWGVVVALALLVSPGLPVAQDIGRNLLLVLTALYAIRGLGVFASLVRRVPGPVLFAGALAALFLFPFVATGLAIFGLADTWLDFRRRQAPPISGAER
jgi:hypothetical protein